MGFSLTAVFQRSRNKDFRNGAKVSSGYQFARFSRFVAPIFGVRELLWPSPKSTNFPENWDTDYRGDK